MRRTPLAILILLAADAALIALPVVDFIAGSPFPRLRNFIYLDAETTLQAWYSSMQWFVAAGLFGLFAIYAYRSRMPGTLALAAFCALCVAFSIDEIAGIHEWVGQELDVLLPGGERANSVFARTGIWPILIGIPVLAVLATLVWRARKIFVPRAPRAFFLLAIGLATMFAGALAIELLVNLLDRPESASEYQWTHLLQHASEEFLEMLGVTLIIWSGLELLERYGFALRIPLTAPQSVPAQDARGAALATRQPVA